MRKIAIATDSNSGISQEDAGKVGIRVLPMPFYIDDELYYEGETLTREIFFEKLEQGAEVSTSQPVLSDLLNMWDDMLQSYEEVIYIPMSSGLSGSCSTAMALSQDYGGKVHVIDNQRISVPQRQSVYHALYMAEKGMSAEEITEILMRDKLDAYAKVRGIEAAKKTMLEAIEHDIQNRFSGVEIELMAAYTCTEDHAEIWKEQIKERFPGMEVEMNALPLSISCHTGAGAVAVGCAKKLTI